MVVNVITASLKSEPPSGWIFYGPYGTGKTSLARLYAKSLLCEKLDGVDSCNMCYSCLSFDSGSNPNYHEEDSASKSGVADVESMLESAGHYPIGASKYRVFVLDECHLMSSTAQSRLLKILEDGIGSTVFILVTTHFDKIIETVRSRLMKINLSLCDSSIIRKNLINVCKSEGFEYDENAVEYLAYKSRGHFRDSLNYLEQVSYLGPITEKNVMRLYRDRNVEDACDLLFNLDKDLSNSIRIYNELDKRMTPSEIRTLLLECLNNSCQWALIKNTHINHETKQYKNLFEAYGEKLFSMFDYFRNNENPDSCSLLQSLLVVSSFIRGVVTYNFSDSVGNKKDPFTSKVTRTVYRKKPTEKLSESEITLTDFVKILKGELISS